MPIPESARKTKSRKFRFALSVIEALDRLSPTSGSQTKFVSKLILAADAKSTKASKKVPTKP